MGSRRLEPAADDCNPSDSDICRVVPDCIFF